MSVMMNDGLGVDDSSDLMISFEGKREREF